MPQNEQAKPARILWLTDTYGDHNGVSTVLKAIHHEIRSRNLPVDLMICSDTIEPEDHLIVVKPVSEVTLPVYRQQPFRIPNYLAVRRHFLQGGYDRIICSTEGPMGLAALWLKRWYGAETFFYLHTDWIKFASEAMSIGPTGQKRIERLLRIYYKKFGKIFVLNTEQQQWLTGREMGFDPSSVFLTAHWADAIFTGSPDWIPGKTEPVNSEPVILYAGRISREKGVMEIPGVFRKIRAVIPGARMIFAGTGPAEEALREAFPEAVYLGWVDREQLPGLYRSADILLLPSRFDTFSCVVLEALSCGLPVAAYNSKGPRDIIEDSVCGYLVETDNEMAEKVTDFLSKPETRARMKESALERARDFEAGLIMDRLLADAGIILQPCSP